jgi:hypothetical protein
VKSAGVLYALVAACAGVGLVPELAGPPPPGVGLRPVAGAPPALAAVLEALTAR